MTCNDDMFCDITSKVCAYYPRDSIDAFGDIVITRHETDMFNASTLICVTASAIERLRSQIDYHGAHACLMFAVRGSIHAARTHAPAVVESVVSWLLVDPDLLDYRDVLVGLSIIEDCADRLDVDLEAVLTPRCDLASERRRHTIRQGWFSRPKDERTIRVGGLEACIGVNGVYFRKAL